MSQSKWLEHTVTPEEAGMTVEQVIREKMQVSGRMLQRLTRSKGIQVNRKTPFLGRKTKEGDRISVRITDRGGVHETPFNAGSARERQPLDCLYEDEWFVIVNKPVGMMVHPVKAGQTETLVHALAAEWAAKGDAATPHPVHRLDKETSGAVLIAKSSYAHQLADRMVRANQIKREYLAILTGRLEEEKGTIHAPIARDPFHKVRRRVHPNGDDAITHFEVLDRTDNVTLARVWLETGRTHQIRVHFAHLRHPLIGDTLYGGSPAATSGQALHAHRLSFIHPLSDKLVEAVANAPEAFSSLLRQHFPEADGKNFTT